MGQVIDHNKMKSALFYVPLVFSSSKTHSHYGQCMKRNLFLAKKGKPRKKTAEEQLEKDSQSFTAKY